MSLLIYIFVLLVILLGIKVYVVVTKGICTCENRLDGKTVLITGGNSGIGFYTALDLAHRGARVIITSENKPDLTRARDEIIKLTGNRNIIIKYLNFLSLEQTRAFVEDIYKTEEKIDILINNAGAVSRRNPTKDGLLPGLQINYFGPFLLTHLLIDLLKKVKNGRIINIASIAAQIGQLDLNDLNKWPDTKKPGWDVYSRSKLLVVYMTWAFAARLKDTGITVNCLHPGVCNTDIFHNNVKWVSNLATILAVYFKTPKDGAYTTIHLSVSDEVASISGKYFEDCKLKRPYIKKNVPLINAVWDKTIEMVKLKSEEIKI